MGDMQLTRLPGAFAFHVACPVPYRRPQPMPGGVAAQRPPAGLRTGRGTPLDSRSETVRSGLLVGCFSTPPAASRRAERSCKRVNPRQANSGDSF